MAAEYDFEYSNAEYYEYNGIPLDTDSGSSRRAYVVGNVDGTFCPNDVENALQSHKNIDTIIYIGHGGTPALYMGTDSVKDDLTVDDVFKLSTKNVFPGATIYLYGCDSIDETPKGTMDIAQAFANHFDAQVQGVIGGNSFGYPICGIDFFPNEPRLLPFGGRFTVFGQTFQAGGIPQWVYPQKK
jgi:hypothetical protein